MAENFSAIGLLEGLQREHGITSSIAGLRLPIRGLGIVELKE